MSTIVTLNQTDIIANSRADINTNFSNLNTDKAEKTLTVNGKALSTSPTLGLATADFANQGTTTTVLHGNASGNPAFGAVVEADQTLADVTTNNVTSTKHGYVPKSAADATKFLNGAATPAFAQVKDSDLSTSDITTNNVSSSKHGFAPKGDGTTTKFLNANGAYSTPGSSVFKNGVTTRAGNASSGSQTIAHGLGTTPAFVEIDVLQTYTTNVTSISNGIYNGTTTSCIYSNSFSNIAGTDTTNIIHIETGTSNSNVATISIDATNITLTWTLLNSPNAATLLILWKAIS